MPTKTVDTRTRLFNGIEFDQSAYLSSEEVFFGYSYSILYCTELIFIEISGQFSITDSLLVFEGFVANSRQLNLLGLMGSELYAGLVKTGRTLY